MTSQFKSAYSSTFASLKREKKIDVRAHAISQSQPFIINSVKKANKGIIIEYTYCQYDEIKNYIENYSNLDVYEYATCYKWLINKNKDILYKFDNGGQTGNDSMKLDYSRVGWVSQGKWDIDNVEELDKLTEVYSKIMINYYSNKGHHFAFADDTKMTIKRSKDNSKYLQISIDGKVIYSFYMPTKWDEYCDKYEKPFIKLHIDNIKDKPNLSEMFPYAWWNGGFFLTDPLQTDLIIPELKKDETINKLLERGYTVRF